MGFFKDFKRDFAQAVNELMPEDGELAGEYDDEDMVNTFDEDDVEIAPEDMLENLDDVPFDEPEPLRELSEDDDDYEELPVTEDDDIFDRVPEAEVLSSPRDIDVETLDFDDGDAEDDISESVDAILSDLATEQPETVVGELPEEETQTSEEDAAAQKAAEDVGSDDETQALDALDETDMTEFVPEAEKIDEAPMPEAPQVDLFEAVAEAVREADSEEQEMENIKAQETIKEKADDIGSIMSDDTTYITKGTTIKGGIETDGGVDVLGSVTGDIKCAGKLIVGGFVKGSVSAGEVYANAAKIEGDIVSEGSVKIGVGSVVVGNVSSTSAVIAGAVNGDIDVKGPVIVDSTAVIMGNIKSRSVQINNGAVIEGFCSQCYSEIDVKSFFE